MSDVGERLKARFAGLRTRVLVPELEGIIDADSNGDPTIYATPFTLDDSKRLQRFIDADSPEGFAEVVVRKAETEAGERMFDVGDKLVLMQCCEAHIVTRVGKALMASVSLEQAEGN